MSKIIYHVENRGSSYIYHWFVYMISGLRHIKNKKPTMGFDGSGKFEQNIGLYSQDFDKPPYRIYISNELSGVCVYKKKWLVEKIKIFKLASLIISPNSGGLTFSLYSDENTNIVELNVANPHQISKQYYDICEKFNIPYIKFTCSKVDNYDNMSVDINNFISFLKNNNLINELSYSN